MLKPLTDFLPWLLLSVILAGCAATRVEKPSQGSSATAPPITVPADARRQYTSALALIKKGQDKQAEPLLQALTRKFPRLAGPYINLGILYARSGHKQEAEAALQHAIQIKPDSAAAHNQLGILYREAGHFKKAEQAYQQALAAKPDYAYAHLNLGILLDLYLQKPDQALTQYERYQQLQKHEDKQVKLWIIDLKRRLKKKP